MSRQNRILEDLLPGKIRKRGCSSTASSSSSILPNYKLKRAIQVGKRRGSSTPLPTWKLRGAGRSPAPALPAMDQSPNFSPFQTAGGNNKSKHAAPVSARKLAATLWEMNEMPSPKMTEGTVESLTMRKMRKEKIAPGRSMHSGSLPQHLSDPSHSPFSERVDRSGTGSRHRRTSSTTLKATLPENNVGVLDSMSNASLMEIENRSSAQTPTGSILGVRNRLKDVSNALTTSKELLKIINRMWGHEDRPSSSMSLISALHAELERARLQVNQHIKEQRSGQSEISFLMKRFAEEKETWRNKEQEVVETAIESVAGELEVEKKLRRRFESLNKKLGRELAETKTYLMQAVRELESEKRARAVIEQVCDDLARDISEDKADAEELKRETLKAREEVEKEREMMQLADMLREERVQMKLCEAKDQLEEKNAAVDKLRSQLEVFLGTKRAKEKMRGSVNQAKDEDLAAYFTRSHSGSYENEENDEYGEVEDEVEEDKYSAESDLRSIELNMDNNNKSYKWDSAPGADHDTNNFLPPFDEDEIKGRKSMGSRQQKKSTPLQRSISDGVDWGIQNEKLKNSADGLDWERFTALDQQTHVKGFAGETHAYKSSTGTKEHLCTGARISPYKVAASPTRPTRNPGNGFQERPPLIRGSVVRSRLSDSRGENQGSRKPIR